MSNPDSDTDKVGETSKVGNEILWSRSQRPITIDEPIASHPTKIPFFRSTLFQILVVGICAFCTPGIWSAMNGLGVGGSQSQDLVNAANALLYAFMTVTCFAGPWLTNLIGFKYTLAIGSLGYPLYAAGLYVNNIFGDTWFVYVGAVACGISAGFFWSVEGAIATGYPESHKRGRYIATWFTFRNFGNIVGGGAVSLGINHKINQKGKAYSGTYLAMYFTVRSRALDSFMSAVVGTLATWLGGSLVDLLWHKSRQVRAISTFVLIALLNSATWIWAIYIQNEYRRTLPVLDWGHQKAFGRGFGVYIFERISLGMVENYIYWCIGNLSDSPGDQIRYSSLLRRIETAGVAVGFGVQAVPTKLIITAGINCGLCFSALPFSYYTTLQVVRKFNKLDAEQKEAADSAVEGQ
ncbi:hypothetical protein BCR34DRAFT_660509 [Clohesyomyces aquaticus]|uniref:Major facilitator superfamily domain-containing protein n=1 Tax=Clohesyomyces aquaticus TaxID=1231657 RepID=A0A1Y2A6G9_9PLEO|nr:hypothetical protein BCR34DRAFT_660509 [Clohesyomyces aquaticus]